MTHRNSPLTPEGRLRLVRRCASRPIAHVAAEAGVSRQCLSKWVHRYRDGGDQALLDRSSAPKRRPTRTPQPTIDRIVDLRKRRRWSARTIASHLDDEGTSISTATVTRHLKANGLNRLRHLDPVTGEPNRRPRVGKIIADYPGHMIHIDVKNVGRIPNGGGWRLHGRGSPQARAAAVAKAKGARAGYTYLHSAIDGFTRLAYTEPHYDETAATAMGFLARAHAFFAAHGISSVSRIITDNAACYRSHAFRHAVLDIAARHQRVKPYTPKHNGKIERYQQILSHELLYARGWGSEQQRSQAIRAWLIHYNYHRPHTAVGDQPPASRAPPRVTNVMRNNT